MEKPPDLDKTVMMMDTPPVTPQAGQKEMPTEKTLPDSEKKKKTKKKKKSTGEEAVGTSASTLKKAGPKVTALQEARDEIALREQLDAQFGPLAEPAPWGAQAPAVSLQEVALKGGEQMEEASEAVPPREARGTTPVANFAKLLVSAGTWERQKCPLRQRCCPSRNRSGNRMSRWLWQSQIRKF